MYRTFAAGARGSNSFSDTESAIRGLCQDFCTAFNTGNYDQAAALFAAEAIFMPPHREPAQGEVDRKHAPRIRRPGISRSAV